MLGRALVLVLALTLMMVPAMAGKSPVPPIKSETGDEYHGHINVYSSLDCKSRVTIEVSESINPYIDIPHEIVLEKGGAKRVEFTVSSDQPVSESGVITATHKCINSSGMLQSTVIDEYEVKVNFISPKTEPTKEPTRESSGGGGAFAPMHTPTPTETTFKKGGVEYKKVTSPATPTPTLTPTVKPTKSTPTRTLTPEETPPKPSPMLQPQIAVLLVVGMFIGLSLLRRDNR